MVSNKGERFQHDIQLTEGCYRGFWDETMLNALLWQSRSNIVQNKIMLHAFLDMTGKQ